jgi:hypothetical protein
MDAADGNSLAAIGFLTALEDTAHGWFGGYLVLSQLGRPLEFHCTTPIQPTRAQQILYGPTLRPYLLGEVIGHTLVDQAELPVEAVLTDLPEMLSLSLLQQAVVACVERVMDPAWPTRGGAQTDVMGTCVRPHIAGWEADESAPSFEIGHVQLHGTSTCNWEPEQLKGQLTSLVEHIDLLEPFSRIREAILEAQRISADPDEGPLATRVAA